MLHQKKALDKFLTDAEKVVILGVGSEIRGDDAAGILITKKLSSLQNDKIHFLLGHTAPENLTGEIKRIKPSHIIMIDAAEMGKTPGDIGLFDADKTTGITFSTHKLPLKLMVEYLRSSFTCKVALLGIQPHTTDFCTKPTSKMYGAIDKTVKMIAKSLKGLSK